MKVALLKSVQALSPSYQANSMYYAREQPCMR